MSIYLTYLRMVLRHKFFVFLEACRLGIPWLGLVHDWTKFLPAEFVPYARWFYGDCAVAYVCGSEGFEEGHTVTVYANPPVQMYIKSIKRGKMYLKSLGEKAAFDGAWNHHQKRNKHHWQRWLLTLDSARTDGKLFPVPMPDRYRREMLADWRGAGRAYGNPNTAEWYMKNRDQMQLHPQTREWVEAELGLPTDK